MTPPAPVCGVLYQEHLQRYAATPEALAAFTAGFVAGQAEKVYLGACPAAMFRPSLEKRATLLALVREIAQRYGLEVIEPVGRHQEIWISRAGQRRRLQRLRQLEENSESWHILRGILCGVPGDELDPQFHHRPGYGQDCDTP